MLAAKLAPGFSMHSIVLKYAQYYCPLIEFSELDSSREPTIGTTKKIVDQRMPSNFICHYPAFFRPCDFIVTAMRVVGRHKNCLAYHITSVLFKKKTNLDERMKTYQILLALLKILLLRVKVLAVALNRAQRRANSSM
jgi:hypothetical protein